MNHHVLIRHRSNDNSFGLGLMNQIPARIFPPQSISFHSSTSTVHKPFYRFGRIRSPTGSYATIVRFDNHLPAAQAGTSQCQPLYNFYLLSRRPRSLIAAPKSLLNLYHFFFLTLYLYFSYRTYIFCQHQEHEKNTSLQDTQVFPSAMPDRFVYILQTLKIFFS